LRSPWTILIVDDDSEVREVMREMLEPEGHKILLAANASQARKLFAGQEIHLAFLDVALPGEPGSDLCQSLKSDPETQHIKIVLLTGLDGEAAWRDGLRSGADLYAVKPFSRDRILLIIEQLLESTGAWDLRKGGPA
jgi:DNA-binding response OmpR family regulator